jgi:protein SCO1/2
VAIVRTVVTLFVATSAMLCGCVRSQHYDLRGQVLAVDRGRQEVTIKHEDIRGFMPGMTMPFRVSDPALLNGLEAGDLVQATLVVKDYTGYLTALRRTGHETPPPLDTPSVAVLQPGERVPDVRLLDETATTRAIGDWRGKVLVVTFIYTRCPFPDFCPRMDRQFKSVQTDVLADPQLRDRVALLSVTFDPAFDTPPVLAAHAKQLGADSRIWHFATGDPEVIERFASRLGVSVIREGTNAENVTHNLRTAVIGPDGTLRTVFSGNEWTPAQLIDAVRHAD